MNLMKKLDSPLVVHKITDASYQETANEVDVDFTHNESEAAATLERHRYRKVKKRRNGLMSLWQSLLQL